jgi:ketosteroid isomerase-like protein
MPIEAARHPWAATSHLDARAGYNAPMMLSLLVTLTLAATQAQPPATQAGDNAEAVVAAVVEDLREAELVLDADALGEHLAYSFTLVDSDGRVTGSFAYLEPLRRLRERGGTVKELRFDSVMVRVFGASAVASYELHMVWTDGGVRHRLEGWASDVFEKRDDGAWILVHRHRP